MEGRGLEQRGGGARPPTGRSRLLRSGTSSLGYLRLGGAPRRVRVGRIWSEDLPHGYDDALNVGRAATTDATVSRDALSRCDAGSHRVSCVFPIRCERRLRQCCRR